MRGRSSLPRNIALRYPSTYVGRYLLSTFLIDTYISRDLRNSSTNPLSYLPAYTSTHLISAKHQERLTLNHHHHHHHLYTCFPSLSISPLLFCPPINPNTPKGGKTTSATTNRRMGNICGKADSEAFSQPGRVLGSAPPPQPQRASVPAGARGPTPPKVVGGPPRTLGGRAGAGGGEAADEARRRAAEAAEVCIYLSTHLIMKEEEERRRKKKSYDHTVEEGGLGRRR